MGGSGAEQEESVNSHAGMPKAVMPNQAILKSLVDIVTVGYARSRPAAHCAAVRHSRETSRAALVRPSNPQGSTSVMGKRLWQTAAASLESRAESRASGARCRQ